jgi:putative transposase
MLMTVTDETTDSPGEPTDEGVTAEAPAGDVVGRSIESLLSPERLDQLLADAEVQGLEIDGPGGLLARMTKTIIERAFDAEMTDHLGYDRGDPAGEGSGNSRNGYYPKTVVSRNGPIELRVPRDRAGSFEPKVVPKRRRRLGNMEDMVLSLYARGMTTRDIKAHLAEVYELDVSHEWVAKITDVVMDEIRTWQNRPLDEVYPVIYIDALRVKIRDGGTVITKAAYVAVGIDVEGHKHILGLWLAKTEGAKFWLQIATELANRGIRDVLIVCCDGLTGLPDAITTVWPATTVQTCVVHLIRGTLRYTSYNDRKAVTKALKPIYTAPSIDAAVAAFEEFKAAWGARIPGAVALWEHAWEEFIPFLAYPPPVRKVIYTTNLIESINYMLRKITKTRGHFPNDDAALKLLYLGVRNIDTRRGGHSGTGTQGWKQALNAFAIHHPGRLPLN